MQKYERPTLPKPKSTTADLKIDAQVVRTGKIRYVPTATAVWDLWCRIRL